MIWTPLKKIYFSRGNITPTFSSISFAPNYSFPLYWLATNSKRKNSIVLKIVSDLSASCRNFSIVLFTFASLVSVLFLKYFYPLVSRNCIFDSLFYFMSPGNLFLYVHGKKLNNTVHNKKFSPDWSGSVSACGLEGPRFFNYRDIS